MNQDEITRDLLDLELFDLARDWSEATRSGPEFELIENEAPLFSPIYPPSLTIVDDNW